jgi:hypothetical protein
MPPGHGITGFLSDHLIKKLPIDPGGVKKTAVAGNAAGLGGHPHQPQIFRHRT